MKQNKNASDKLSNQKCALYVRVSTHWQIDKDSLPVQREDLINYAKYALNIDKYEIFEDAGYSAKNTDRLAFQHQRMAVLLAIRLLYALNGIIKSRSLM